MMGWFDSFPFLSSLYGGQRSHSLDTSRSRIRRSQFDGVPLHPHRKDPITGPPGGLNSICANSNSPSHIFNYNDEPTTFEHEISPPELVELPQEDMAACKNSKTVFNKDSGPPAESSELKQSGRLYSGLAGFIALFRRRRVQRQDLASGPVNRSQWPDISNIAIKGDSPDETMESTYNSADCCTDTQTSQKSSVDRFDDAESRKVSDQTVFSEDSTQTTITVCRNPSKRASRPVNRNRVRESSRSATGSSLFSDLAKTTTPSSRPPSSEFSNSDSRAICHADIVRERLQSSMVRRNSKSGSLSQQSSCHAAFSEGGTVSDSFDQGVAAIEFNRVAETLGLPRLQLHDGDRPVSVEPQEEIFSSRRERFFGKIRTMRSNVSMKRAQDRPERMLRRIKTLASISSRPPPLASLKGKSLETLARLGGHSFLTLPGDFAPTTLRLPVCFVATVTYLRCYAPNVRNVFVDDGGVEVATQMYDYFANQVLSAEREKDKIQMTMRASDMPFGPGYLDTDYGVRHASQVKAVACVFKSLLAGLPGGILGSAVLYRILLDICYRDFPESEFKDVKSYLADLTPAQSAKVHAIALAVLALTSEMQLELVCAVFGLFAVMLYGTKRMKAINKLDLGSRVRSSFVSGELNEDCLSRVFGPLLTDPERELHHPSAEADRRVEHERVANMLIQNWRSVSRLLKVWEKFGYPVKRVAVPWTACEGPSSVEEKKS